MKSPRMRVSAKAAWPLLWLFLASMLMVCYELMAGSSPHPRGRTGQHQVQLGTCDVLAVHRCCNRNHIEERSQSSVHASRDRWPAPLRLSLPVLKLPSWFRSGGITWIPVWKEGTAKCFQMTQVGSIAVAIKSKLQRSPG
ncbi:unnamed protein product, partial [Pipistrellus nathusii]